MADGARLWIVDPAMNDPEEESHALLSSLWGEPSQVLLPALRPEHVAALDPSYPFEALIVLGSGASPHDRYPWLLALSRWLLPLLEGSVIRPLLGVCFGHQLLARLAGGEVGFLRPDRSKLLARVSTRLEGSRLFDTPKKLSVIASHREVVTRPPDSFKVVGSRDGVPTDAMEHLSLPVFGVQFHPEVRGDFAERTGLGRACVDERLVRDGDSVLSSFLRLARSLPRTNAER